MVFSSTIFLCVYLPLVLLGYYICPKKGRNLFLLIVSLVFYAWGEPKYVFLMIFSILINYVFGRLMDKNRGRQKRMKLLLVLSVVIDIGLLSVFKYTDFIITNVNAIFGANFDLLNIALPIGISFYTFQAMSYTIDVYRDDVRVQKNLIDFGMYITMFPQLIAGPIVRYADVQDQLAERSVTTADFFRGRYALRCRPRQKGAACKPDGRRVVGNIRTRRRRLGADGVDGCDSVYLPDIF